MKLRIQILSIGLAGAATAALVGVFGWMGVHHLSQALDRSTEMNLAAQSSQTAAMMHDAIRGDIQRAMLGLISRDSTQIKDAGTALDGHINRINESINILKESALSKHSKETISKTVPLVEKYTESARHVMELASSMSGAAGAIPGFQTIYTELEAQMALQVEEIHKDELLVLSRSAEVVDEAKFFVVVSLSMATFLLIGSSLWLARNMSQPMGHAVEIAMSLANGDLTAEIHPSGNDETIQLLSAMDDMRFSLSSIVRTVKDNADNVANASSEIAMGNQDLSSRTELQASSLEETSAAMEELNISVMQNAANSVQANALAKSASKIADEGGAIVEQMVTTMKEINDSAKTIFEIISVIDSIAFQTNILALNAAVEAARAGDQGRGFAVVASEVRSLAGRSSDAAKQIKTLIVSSVERVERGSTLVNKAGATMVDVVSSINRVATIMSEISNASSIQTTDVIQVVESVQKMDETTQQNAALVEQMAAAASSLSMQANDLVRSVSQFKIEENGISSNTVDIDNNADGLNYVQIEGSLNNKRSILEGGLSQSLLE
jgi:methyl-accepting chemotaxis protein